MEKYNWRDHYKKAVTFSYDDSVATDLRLIEILNRYGLKCTFNVNTGLNAANGSWTTENGVRIDRLTLEEHAKDYAGHEIAVHTLTHPSLTGIPMEEAIREVKGDIENIERIFGVRPVGMAYPYGTFNPEVAQMLRDQGIRYGRTVWDAENFDEQEDLLVFRPTCHHENPDLFEKAKKFLETETDKPQIFYVWGHTYEFACNDNWERIEELCRMISGRDDIFYGTNAEVLL